jgi:hypothetical protein
MTSSTTVFRLLAIEDKAAALKAAARGGLEAHTFVVSVDSFAQIPGAPFAYSLSVRARDAFRVHPKWESVGRSAHQGLATADNFRFVRGWWEGGGGDEWRPLAKGATRVPFYGELSLLMNWRDDGAEMKAWAGSLYNNSHWSRIMMNAPLYFVPGITYSRRPHQRGWFQFLPPGVIFSTDSPLIVGGSVEQQLCDCVVLNSMCFSRLLGVLMARGTEGGQTLKYETGYVSAVPLPDVGLAREVLVELARRGFSIACELDSRDEVSRYFTLPGVLRQGRGLVVHSSADLMSVLEEIDRTADSLYGLRDGDFGLDATSRVAGAAPAEAIETGDDNEAEASLVESSGETLISWAVGVAFARFDSRLATGERHMPASPQPFDPLPSRSPGMFPEGEEPAERPDILVDDEGHPDDLAARVSAVAERVKLDPFERLRVWLAKEFFPLHIKMYSKSRRKAPIYWQLATPSASYSVWLYVQGFSKDTLFRVQNDYVAPKLAHEERRLQSLASELRDGATAAQRKTLAAQEAMVDELRALLDEVKRVAPLWKPNLDDGVIVNFAPLWRLVPQNKAWQKELKSAWDALCDEKYDWSHLAMHLWPERVVPKCAKDRSLAIAHRLADVFWVEAADGKWVERKTPAKSVDELVKARTSPAVKSALKSLLEAPVASGKSSSRKGGGRRKAGATEGDA